jgi:heme A synthase
MTPGVSLEPEDRRFATFGWGLLVYTLFVVAFGAWVRITGSGAGCGQHWPSCHGEIVPPSPTVETIIEFTHRVSSGGYGIVVLVFLVWAIRRFPRGHLVRTGAWLTFIFTITEALVGAGLVKRGLVADDDSIERAVVMAIHLVNTSFLTGALGIACWAAGAPAQRARLAWRQHPRAAWLLLGCILGLGIVGMSGAVTALGDTLFPVSDSAGPWAARLVAEQSAGAHFLQRARALHPVLAIGVAGLVLWVAQRIAGRADPASDSARWAGRVTILVIAQVTAGVVNVMLSAPGWMQIVHLVIATLLWVAFVILTATVLAPARASASPIPS